LKIKKSTLKKQLIKNKRKVRIITNLHDPYKLGYTLATIVITKRSNSVKRSKSFKNYLSSDYSLQFKNIKEESLVIIN
jgi:hypothetical protein